MKRTPRDPLHDKLVNERWEHRLTLALWLLLLFDLPCLFWPFIVVSYLFQIDCYGLWTDRFYPGIITCSTVIHFAADIMHFLNWKENQTILARKLMIKSTRKIALQVFASFCFWVIIAIYTLIVSAVFLKFNSYFKFLLGSGRLLHLLCYYDGKWIPANSFVWHPSRVGRQEWSWCFGQLWTRMGQYAELDNKFTSNKLRDLTWF